MKDEDTFMMVRPNLSHVVFGALVEPLISLVAWLGLFAYFRAFLLIFVGSLSTLG